MTSTYYTRDKERERDYETIKNAVLNGIPKLTAKLSRQRENGELNPMCTQEIMIRPLRKKMGRPLLDLGIRYHGRIISVNMGLGGLDIEETKVRDVIQQCLSDLTESQGYRFDFRR